MIKFTKEEISLCKQIEEKHRKEIEYGAWYIDKDNDRPILAVGNLTLKSFISLWTISDCLEFLRNEFRSLIIGVSGEFEIRLSLHGYKYGKTPLEACLKAVLAVLEEGK